jgi:adenylate cyclase
MTPRFRLLLLVCGLIPTLAMAGLSIYRPPFLTNVDYRVYDMVVRSAPLHPPSGRVVIVDVDERSLSTFGQWPWRRDRIAQLIDRLRNLGASTVALDMILSESDRDGIEPRHDAALADSLRMSPVVLGYALTFDASPGVPRPCVQHPLGLAVIRNGDRDTDDPFFRATGAVCSLPLLTQAARASGFLNAAPDSDGLLRRVPLLMQFGGRVYPGLAFAAVTAMTGASDIALRVANVNASSILRGGGSIPLDGKSNLLLRYRGAKGTFPYVSAADVLSGAASADAFREKLVFVGTTALGTREDVSTPLDTLFTGVEVQATVADNLLQDDWIHRPEHGQILETLVVLALGVLAFILVGRLGLAWTAVGMAACLATLWAVAVSLMSTRGIFVSPLFPTMGVSGALAAMTVAGLAIERRRADRADQQTGVSQHLMVQTLLSLTEAKDTETGRHSRRTERYTRVLAEQLATHPEFRDYLTPERIALMARLAPLHDIGKVGVPDHVLNKAGTLTAEEWMEIRTHPERGRDVLLKAEEEVGVHDDVTLAMAKEIVYTHHERWDGAGYPQGLRGREIPIAGRLMAVVDVYDAVISRRLYAPQMSHDEAVSFIVAGRGTHFDPAVVDAFLEVSPALPDHRPSPESLTLQCGSPVARLASGLSPTV